MRTSSRPGWTRISRPACGGVWQLDADPRWTVRHCGHPTAHWPYYGQGPNEEDMIIAPNGYAYRFLVHAQEAVEVASGVRRDVSDSYLRLYYGPDEYEAYRFPRRDLNREAPSSWIYQGSAR